MIDPRSDIIGLFTNSRIGADSRYSGTSVYIKIVSTEDNENTEPNDYGDKYVGILWLKPPRQYLNDLTISFTVTEHEAIVDCDLIIPRNDKWLKNNHSTFINNIVDLFERTIRENSTTSGKTWDIAMVDNILVSVDVENPNIYRRLMELRCYKAD